MKRGDIVLVRQLGEGITLEAEGRIVIISENEEAIVIGFVGTTGENPFGFDEQYPELRYLMCLYRPYIDGFLEPWTDLFGERKFEITAV